MRIGPYSLPNNLLLAPMAGITDQPFRQLCRRFGAGLAVSEMVISNTELQQHPRTLQKTDYTGETGLRAVQILGNDPVKMAEAAKLNQQRGAHIIDINMGCPAKKVCSTAAGSALLKDEKLVENILTAVVAAVDIPVTLKIRTGWDRENRNAAKIASIAENCGIQALTIHGRTRACKFEGQAEYDTIRQVKQTARIPIIANGDIDSPEKARRVLAHTGADAIMIGRAAQGQPWIFAELAAALNGEHWQYPALADVQGVMNSHLEYLYRFYGDDCGVRIARKHIGWYFERLGGLPAEHKQSINQAQHPVQQLTRVNASFNHLLPRAA
ncbi:tRNA dihydrouridine synthase DusB [Methylomonas sp. MED-D]|uniref:tRNA dihydrouridine synthase DusB n=1 Tax=unclassified Methylomonas TaxID=2608980 RepID=UPI0008DB0064|nr:MULTISPECIES: tRNA dihydrouridine synthase DusB [unclassified Methylomonas]MDT4332315.1 tRNA dihydrouridine synthase DusB [Methylomonas sp. MV1]NJA07913.1 tRNA dihydrouridine synthase DusB [Methylococcaceae bacterium WWC4]OHX37623.1 tRNA dihydrouridine synthase DusB [Methylomonas sp. LWB]WGS85515.1 tRNA dihydrouridine synthase DusB [Methylomonas sp. UP202]